LLAVTVALLLPAALLVVVRHSSANASPIDDGHVLTVSTAAGNGVPETQDGVGVLASTAGLFALTTYGGTVYMAEQSEFGAGVIRSFEVQTGQVTTLAGSAQGGPFDCVDAPDGTSVRFPSFFAGIATDGVYLYTLHACGLQNNVIRRTSISTGATSTVTSLSALPFASSITFADGFLYVPVGDESEPKVSVWQIDPASGATTLFAEVALPDAGGLAAITADDADLWVIWETTGDSGMAKIALSGGSVTDIPVSQSPDTDFFAQEIVSAGDQLYMVSGDFFERILLYDKPSDAWASVAGLSGEPGYANGSGAAARFHGVSGLAFDGESLWIADTDNYRLRRGVLGPPLGSIYVAMGDSYQSGVGAPPYVPGTDIEGLNRCKRSPLAHPARLVDLGVIDLDLDFVACGGATVGDLYEAGPSTSDPPYNEGSQLGNLGPDTGLVTIGIGGNDVGFSEVILVCGTAGFIGGSCFAVEGPQVANKLTALTTPDPVTGLSVLETLLADIRVAAPNAQVLVLGYPQLFAVGVDLTSLIGILPQPKCHEIGIADQVWINDGVRTLDDAIRAAAENQGLQYVEMYEASDSSDLCHFGSEPDFFHGIELTALGDSFHPTPFGYAQMTDEISLALGLSPGEVFDLHVGELIETGVEILGGVTTSVSASWQGSDVVLSLVSPSGRVIDRDTEANDVYHRNGPTNELYRIEYPEPGTWTVRLYGADVAPEGEEVTLVTHEQPIPNQNPVAAFTMNASDQAVAVNAAPSNDEDGEITEYFWDFGDGAYADGIAASHVYADPGTYRVVLVVQDDDGGLGFAAADSAIVVPESPVPELTDLGDAHLWVGLENSDDQGTRFDLQVELLRNGTAIASGLERCVADITRNPSQAKEVVVDWNAFPDTEIEPGDALSLRVSTRIGTNPDGTKCSPGHNTAVGLRVYYDATSRASRLGIAITPDPSVEVHLRSNGSVCGNGPSAGVTSWYLSTVASTTATAKCKDSASIGFAGGNPFREVGNWSLPPVP
jgi:PKD repeat protein